MQAMDGSESRRAAGEAAGAGHVQGSANGTAHVNGSLKPMRVAVGDRDGRVAVGDRDGRTAAMRDATAMGATARARIVEDAVRQILVAVGEDADRDGLADTPGRVARMYEEMLEGYTLDLATVINGALFDVAYDAGEMITVSEIPYTSLCEHHMLPFVGTAHVAYIPRDRVVGLSKIPRIVDMFARRLQIQERLTGAIADALVEALNPLGVMVVVDGQHSCAALRGVKKHGLNMVTVAKRGRFRTDRDLRDEFYRQIGR